MGRIIPTNNFHANACHTHTQSDTITCTHRQRYTYEYQGIGGSKVAESHTLTSTDIHMGIRVAVLAR